MYPTKKLWEICEFQWWTQPPKSEFIYEEKEWYVRFLQIRDFSNDKNITYIPNSHKNRICKTDDILLARYWASIGKILTGKSWAFNVAILKTIPNENILYKKFFYWYLLCPLFQKLLSTTSQRAAQDWFNQKDIENFLVPLPPLPTQQKIVSKLDSLFEKLDQAITLTKQNLVSIEELNKSILEKIFKECEEKYEKRKIQDFSEVKSWKRLPKWEKVESFNTWYPYIRVTDFLDTWTVNLNTVMYISEKNFNTICDYIITKDDLYISIAWTIWKTWIIPEELNWANLTENAVRLVYKDRDKIFNKYIYYFTLSENFKNQAWLATRAVAMPKLAISRLKQISIPLPPLSEQQKIVEYLDNIFAKNKILQEKYKQDLQNLEELKQSILKQAFEDEDFIK